MKKDKFSLFWRIFAKFGKLNSSKKSTGSQFAKLKPRAKKIFFFFRFFRISKTYIFTLGSLSISNVHLKNTLRDIRQHKQRQHRKKNVNHFIISAPFDLLLGIQSRIKYFISKQCYLKYQKNWVRVP